MLGIEGSALVVSTAVLSPELCSGSQSGVYRLAVPRPATGGGWALALVGAGVVLSLLLLEAVSSMASCFYSTGARVAGVESFEKLVLEASWSTPVAVMFRSPGCPVCERVYPLWRVWEDVKGLPAVFVDVELSPTTMRVFEEYGVYDLPSFIVFYKGSPVARRTGAFSSSSEILTWVTSVVAGVAAKLYGGAEGVVGHGLEVYSKSCSKCHGGLEALSRGALESWAKSSGRLGRLVLEASRTGGGSLGFYAEKIAGMAARCNVSGVDAASLAYMLSYASRVLAGATGFPPLPSVEVEEAGRAEAKPSWPAVQGVGAGLPVSVLAFVGSLAAGVGVGLSPCAAPLLLALAALAGRRGVAGGLLCGVLAWLGVAGVALVFVVAGSLLGGLSGVLYAGVGGLVLASGFMACLGVSVAPRLPAPRSRCMGLLCLGYGFLAVLCSLPLAVAGVALAASGGLVEGLARLAGFALGVAVPVAVIVSAAGRARRLLERIASRSVLVERAIGVLLVVVGGLLLAHGVGLL